MLRQVRIVLVVVLTFTFAMSFALADDTQGWDLAFALIEKETGYTRDQLEKVTLVYGNGQYAFSAKIINHPADEDGLLVGEMDASGNKISFTGPEKIDVGAQVQRDLKNCFNRRDCYLLLADVCADWNEKLASADEETMEMIWEPYRAILAMGITTPPDDVIDYDTAYTAAWTELTAYKNWTADAEELFRLTISAYYVLNDEPVYFFYFEDHSYFEDAYSTDAAMKRYEKKLAAYFAEINQQAPCKIGVVISAKTGKLVEPPMMDYIPVQYHYLDFMIRTEEAVASIAQGEQP